MDISFFENEEEIKQNKLDKTIDELKNKYGYDLITRAGKLDANKLINIRSEKNEIT